jgi:hypothetical protein
MSCCKGGALFVLFTPVGMLLVYWLAFTYAYSGYCGPPEDAGFRECAQMLRWGTCSLATCGLDAMRAIVPTPVKLTIAFIVVRAAPSDKLPSAWVRAYSRDTSEGAFRSRLANAFVARSIGSTCPLQCHECTVALVVPASRQLLYS